jgi:hypothetical protein
MVVLCYVAAVVVFALAAFGVTIGSAGELDLVAFGLALFALGHLLPGLVSAVNERRG